MITLKSKGDFKNTTKFLNKVLNRSYLDILEKYGREGVAALSAATPVDTGLTAASWDYKIEATDKGFSISFTNSNRVDGVLIAIILQYGHVTNNGGWVEGRDYINPAIQPIFDRMAQEAWKEVIN